MKQAIVVRQDLKLPKGKLAAQASHASLEAALSSKKETLEAWRRQGAKKVVLKAADEKELLELERIAKSLGVQTALITDAGHTVVEPGTITCLGIGPDKEELIDKVTGKLKMV